MSEHFRQNTHASFGEAYEVPRALVLTTKSFYFQSESCAYFNNKTVVVSKKIIRNTSIMMDISAPRKTGCDQKRRLSWQTKISKWQTFKMRKSTWFQNNGSYM